MKKLILAILCTVIVLPLFSQSVVNDTDAIKEVIQVSYIDGLQNLKNVEAIKDGFHPGFNLLIFRNNMIEKLPIYNWIEFAKQRKAKQKEPLTEENTTTVRFLNIDITETAAVAKIELSKGGKVIFIDYLSLYKFNEGWKIVSKIYYRMPE